MTQGEKLQATLEVRFGSAEAVHKWRSAIGAKGGSKSRGGGFGDPKLAARAGSIGGKASRRPMSEETKLKRREAMRAKAQARNSYEPFHARGVLTRASDWLKGQVFTDSDN